MALNINPMTLRNITYIPINRMQTGVTNALRKLIQRAEQEMSSEIKYRDIEEYIQNHSKSLHAKGVSFSITQDFDNYGKHLLEVCVEHPTMSRDITRPLAYGDRNEIINCLRKLDTEQLMKVVNDMANALK